MTYSLQHVRGKTIRPISLDLGLSNVKRSLYSITTISQNSFKDYLFLHS